MRQAPDVPPFVVGPEACVTGPTVDVINPASSNIADTTTVPGVSTYFGM